MFDNKLPFIVGFFCVVLIMFIAYYVVGGATNGTQSTNNSTPEVQVISHSPAQEITHSQPTREATHMPITSVQPSVGTTAADEIKVLPSGDIVKYGDIVKLRNVHAIYGGYASVCGRADICGENVTVAPLSAGNNLWKILGGAIGDPVKVGGIIELKSTTRPFSMSPCDRALYQSVCGVGVTMRTDSEFNRWEPNSNLRNWKVIGSDFGSYLTYDMTFSLKGLATRWAGHDGVLSVCGSAAACGWDLTLRRDHATFDQFKFER